MDSNTKVNSVAECCQTCTQTDGCKAWTVHLTDESSHAPQTCFLKTGEGGWNQTYKEGWTSGCTKGQHCGDIAPSSRVIVGKK